MLTEFLDRLIKYNPLEDIEEAIINLDTKRALYLLKRYPKLASEQRVIYLAYQKRNLKLIKYLVSVLPKNIVQNEIKAPSDFENPELVFEDYFKDYDT